MILQSSTNPTSLKQQDTRGDRMVLLSSLPRVPRAKDSLHSHTCAPSGDKFSPTMLFQKVSVEDTKRRRSEEAEEQPRAYVITDI